MIISSRHLTEERMDFDDFEPWRKRMAEAFAARPDIEITKFSREVLGKNRDYVTRLITKGTANPSPSLLIDICEKIGASPAYIISGEQASTIKDKVARRLMTADDAMFRRVDRALDLLDVPDEESQSPKQS